MTAPIEEPVVVLDQEPEPVQNALTANIAIARICGQRDKSLRLMRKAAVLIQEGHRLATEAANAAEEAASNEVFSLRDRRKDETYRRLFAAFNAEESFTSFREHTDACVWAHLLKATGMETLMDAEARDEFYTSLVEEPCPNCAGKPREIRKECSTCSGRGVLPVPEVNEDNILATLQGLHSNSRLIFLRGLANAFAALDRKFKSHDAFKIGSRIILQHVFDAWGHMSHHGRTSKMLTDVERVLAVLDGQKPQPGELQAAIKASRGDSWGPRQGCAESRYLRIRTYKNGNAHLWFTRDDLVEKANLLLAEYYGEVLPDGVAKDDPLPKSGLPAKNLSFYATPAKVVDKMLARVSLRDVKRVLEPSAGVGDIVRALLAKGLTVDAIEIHPDRAAALRLLRGCSVTQANFLQERVRPIYDLVMMNPPFYGMHWMEHVRHAYEFLAEGGTLVTVLPASAELYDTKRHKAFRKWAGERSRRWNNEPDFHDLPPESFASSGTRINTILLVLHK